MDATSVLFYLFSAILVFSGFRVVTARNPVHAALFLVLSFCTGAALWMLIQAEFLAISLVLVYVGAVMVLFLFVVMMLDINFEQMRTGMRRYVPVALLVAGLMAAELVVMVSMRPNKLLAGAKPLVYSAQQVGGDKAAYSNIYVLGMELYTKYVYPFELAAMVLLVAMIAAIALTLRGRKHSRFQDPSEQVKANKANRLRVVRMAAEKPVSSQDEAGDAAGSEKS